MMEIKEALIDFSLTSQQRMEAINAYNESPDAVLRIIKSASGKQNPVAYLMAVINKGGHKSEEIADRRRKSVYDLAMIGETAYRTQIELGADYFDAIAYGVFVASTWTNQIEQDAIERELRKRVGQPWDENSDPDLGKLCPDEILENVVRKAGRFGSMPEPKKLPTPEPDPPTPTDLAARLLAMAGEAA